MKTGSNPTFRKTKQLVAMTLVVLVFVSPTMAGISITSSNGIVMTGADGIVMTGADGIVMTGADGVAYPNSVRATSADGIVMTGADGIVMTGADGIVMTGADGTSYRADSVTITLADGIVMTGADSVRATGADGVVFSVVPDGLRFTGVTGIVMTGADGIVMTGAYGIVMTGADGLLPNAIRLPSTGLGSVDPELALQLTQLADDSTVNAVVIYHCLPADSDLADLQKIGIVGGTRLRALPMITLTGT